MQISDAAAQYNHNVISNASSAVKNQGVERTVSNASGLQPGYIFEGTVNNVKNGVVTIGLSTGDTLQARMDQGVELNKGDSVFFQVKSNADNLIQIRALTGDKAYNPTLEKALNAASLPITAQNLSMVNSMMQEKMSIDSASLNIMARNLAMAPNAEVSTVVQMNKLGIQMTPENISQFENYKVDKGAILDELDVVMDSVPKAISSNQISIENAVNLSKDIVSILTEGLDLSSISPMQMAETEALLNAEQAIANKDVSQLTNVLSELESASAMEQAILEQALFDGDEISAEEALFDNAEMAEENVVKTPSPEQILHKLLEEYNSKSFEQDAIGSSYSPKALMEFSNELKSLDSLYGKIENLFTEDGNINPEKTTAEVMKTIADALPFANKQDASRLLDTPGFQKGIKTLMEQQWLLKPEEVSTGKDAIKELYARLENQMHEIEQAMTKANVPHENFTANATDVKNNIEFMNQINQTYTYVQLPLKMSGQNANGDLYVYTNKKALKDPNSEVSAFLHFDMENLGATDVSVKMLGKNVTTHFYMESEEAMDLIANNIHLLDNRLKAKGYSCNISVSDESVKQDFVHDFLMKDEKNVGTVHRYSFDVRA